MTVTWQLTMDCADPRGMTTFWAAALGYVKDAPPEGFDSWEAWLVDMGIPEEQWNDGGAIVDPEGVRPRIFFQRVPEQKAAKNRFHLDVPASTGPGAAPHERVAAEEAERDRLVTLGATEIGAFEELGGRWIVMQDPEGNEFCIT